VGFDLLHVSVGESGCGKYSVVVGKSGIDGGEALEKPTVVADE
jgi:hypothetical protein